MARGIPTFSNEGPLGFHIRGSARKEVDATERWSDGGYFIKNGSYTIFSQYRVVDFGLNSGDTIVENEKYFVDIEILDLADSKAYTAIVAGATMLMAVLAF